MSAYRKFAGFGLSLALGLIAPTIGHAQDNDSQDIIHTQSNPWVSQNGPQAQMARIGRFVDESGHLPSPARQGITGHREMKVFIWLPHGFQMSAALPIIVLSGKYGTPPASYQNVAGHLASHGFVVIAPDHEDADNGVLSGQTNQKRIDDLHDTIRAIPAIAQNAGFMPGGNLACIGFAEGITDCLMNGGIHSEVAGLHPWGGMFSSILAIGPTAKNIPPGIETIGSPIMIAGSMADMSIKDGILAQHPESAPKSRVLVAIHDFADPYVTINRPDQPETYFWRSIVALWMKGTIGGEPSVLQGIDGYANMTNNYIQTAIR